MGRGWGRGAQAPKETREAFHLLEGIWRRSGIAKTPFTRPSAVGVPSPPCLQGSPDLSVWGRRSYRTSVSWLLLARRSSLTGSAVLCQVRLLEPSYPNRHKQWPRRLGFCRGDGPFHVAVKTVKHAAWRTIRGTVYFVSSRWCQLCR